METLDAIKTRRSVRNYTDETLDINILQDIVTYGLYAPSAHNQQARKYYIISNKQDYEFLGNVMAFWKMLPSAWWVILACFDKSMLRSEEFIQQDMGASIQSILLAAHDKGVWSVWLGLYPHQKEMDIISEHFWFDDNVVPFAIISLWKQACDLPEKTIKDKDKIIVL